MDHLPGIPFPVVTVGSFDGVHAGHRTIIRRLNDLAAAAGGESVLVSFHPHPRKVLYPGTGAEKLKMIYDQEEKCMILAGTGLNHLVIMEFTGAFSQTTPGDFVERYLVDRLGARTIVVGFNHYFGHNRTGNYDSLYRMSERYGFRVEEIPAREIQHEIVSSTRIRRALSDGYIQRANACLEHHFIMQGIATLLPEAAGLPGHFCLDFQPGDPDKLIPPAGTYAVAACCGKTEWKGLATIARDASIRVYTGKDMPLQENGMLLKFYRSMGNGTESRLQEGMEAVRQLLY